MGKEIKNNQPKVQNEDKQEQLHRKISDFVLTTKEGGNTITFQDNGTKNSQFLKKEISIDINYGNFKQRFILDWLNIYALKNWLSDCLNESGELFRGKSFEEIEEWKKEAGNIYFTCPEEYGIALSAEKYKTDWKGHTTLDGLYVDSDEALILNTRGVRESNEVLLLSPQIRELKEFLNKNF